MKSVPQKYGVDLNNKKLHVFDLDDPDCRIEVDQVVFDATSTRGLIAEGYITAVHGMPQDVAALLPAQMLYSLGVGTHITPHRMKPGLKRMRATSGQAKFEQVSHP